MCTSFAKDLKRWTCDEERAARDAMLDGWAQALHEAAQPAPRRDAAEATPEPSPASTRVRADAPSHPALPRTDRGAPT